MSNDLPMIACTSFFRPNPSQTACCKILTSIRRGRSFAPLREIRLKADLGASRDVRRGLQHQGQPFQQELFP